MTVQAIDELRRLADNSVAPLIARLELLIAAHVRADPEEIELRIRQLHLELAQLRTLADLLGRRRVVLQAREFEQTGDALHFRTDSMLFDTPTIPEVPFQAAIDDLVRRTPELADSSLGIPLWQQVRDLYESGPAFALARSTDLTLTKRIQKVTADFLETGRAVPKPSSVIAAMSDFTRAYAENVFRTNMATAYNAGRRQQVKTEGVRQVVLAFRFRATRDRNVRPNHLAADGLILPVDHPLWRILSTPLGYQCRCNSTNFVGRFELERLGLLEPGGNVLPFHPDFDPFNQSALLAVAHPDPGFRTGATDVYG